MCRHELQGVSGKAVFKCELLVLVGSNQFVSVVCRVIRGYRWHVLLSVCTWLSFLFCLIFRKQDNPVCQFWGTWLCCWRTLYETVACIILVSEFGSGDFPTATKVTYNCAFKTPHFIIIIFSTVAEGYCFPRKLCFFFNNCSSCCSVTVTAHSSESSGHVYLVPFNSAILWFV